MGFQRKISLRIRYSLCKDSEITDFAIYLLSKETVTILLYLFFICAA